MTPFGYYLESLRRSRRLQQKQLAALLDVNPCYISAMEKGRKGPPTKPVLDRLITALELNEQEQNYLHEYVGQSERTFRLPTNMALEEYALVHELKNYLGSLSKEQIAIIQNALRVGKVDCSRAGMTNRGVSHM